VQPSRIKGAFVAKQYHFLAVSGVKAGIPGFLNYFQYIFINKSYFLPYCKVVTLDFSKCKTAADVEKVVSDSKLKEAIQIIKRGLES
jgi:hypothetical protein